MEVVQLDNRSAGGIGAENGEQLRELAARRIAGGLLIAGGAMAILGWLLRPVSIDKDIQPDHVRAAGEHIDLWIWSFRALVFGLFIRLAGLVSLATLFPAQPTRAILWPGVAIGSAGLAISAMGEGYYMDEVIHAVWRFGTDAPSAEARTQLITSIMPMTAWIDCLSRMGLMFLSLGTLGVTIALWQSRSVGRAVVILGAIVAIGSMMGLMARPDAISHRIVFASVASWHILLGGAMVRRPR